MTHHTHSPSFPLNQFITHFTYYKNYTPNHRIDRFLPNGNTEVVIDLTDFPKFIYDNDSLKELQACNKIWISGIRNKFITIPSGQNAEMFVINFKKGMVLPFLGLPLHEITDTVINGDLVLDKVFLDLRDKLLDCKCIAEKFLFAEKALLNKYQPVLTVNPFIDYAVNRILTVPDSATIKNIAHKTGYSTKHFIWLFKHHVGVAPKSFLRIIRFQKAISEIERKGQINWAALAIDCGYYDQSHLIADFKNFSGFTPVEYLKKRNHQLNYVPVA